MNFLRHASLLILLAITNIAANAQVSYFKQVKEYTKTAATATQLIFKLDSLKQTRRPTDSGIELLYARDVDFGFKHQKISVLLNSDRYTLDLLTKNDSLIVKIIQYGNPVFNNDEIKAFNKNNNYAEADTVTALKFLSLRNGFYHSHKTIGDLKDELGGPFFYAYACGEAMQKTESCIELEKLVKYKNLKGLSGLLSSISCEQQAFGADGVKMLKKSGYKVPKNMQAIAQHINKRNSELTTCSGCLLGVIAKANK